MAATRCPPGPAHGTATIASQPAHRNPPGTGCNATSPSSPSDWSQRRSNAASVSCPSDSPAGQQGPTQGEEGHERYSEGMFSLSDLRCPFFIEHLLSVLQRRQMRPPTPIPRPHPPKRSKRLRLQSLLNTKIRSTNQDPMQPQVPLNSQLPHLPLHLSLWCNNNSRHRRQTRSRRLMISAALSQT